MRNCNCGDFRITGRLNPIKLEKFGRCRFCIYSTLILSVAGWLVFALVAGSESARALSYTVFIFASVSSVLFAVHIATIIVRAIKRSSPISNSP